MLILVFNEPWTSEAREIDGNYQLRAECFVAETHLAAFFHYTVPEIFSTLPAILKSVRNDGLDGLLRSAEFAQETEELESCFKGIEGHVAGGCVTMRWSNPLSISKALRWRHY